MVEATIIYTTNVIQAGLLAWAMSILVGKEASKKQIALFAVAYGLTVPLSRKIYIFFELPFYTHTLILLIWAFVLYLTIIRLSAFKAVIATLLGILFFLIIDGLIIIQISNLFNISIEAASTNIWLYFLLANVINLCFLFIIAINKIFGFSLFVKENE